MHQTISTGIFGFLAFAAGAHAAGASMTQTTINAFAVPGVPKCANECAASLPSDCNGLPNCICTNTKWINDVACCAAQKCTEADRLITQQFATQLCKYVGKELPPLTCTKSVQPTNNLVNGWIYQGCFTESTNYNRALNTTFHIDTEHMSVDMCLSFCKGQGLPYAGTEYGQECWCGKEIQYVNGAKRADAADCNMPCKGNEKQSCGGSARLNIWKTMIPGGKKRGMLGRSGHRANRDVHEM